MDPQESEPHIGFARESARKILQDSGCIEAPTSLSAVIQELSKYDLLSVKGKDFDHIINYEAEEVFFSNEILVAKVDGTKILKIQKYDKEGNIFISNDEKIIDFNSKNLLENLLKNNPKERLNSIQLFQMYLSNTNFCILRTQMNYMFSQNF